jgi:tRNA threonylcarbamoyladenosine biosynthesis protein TsaE
MVKSIGMISKVLKNLKETEEFGKELAGTLKAGDVITLTGPLGAGKTTLTKAIASGIGVTETITSPTFTIVCEYESGRLPLYHFDVYRVNDEDELFEMGFEEYFHKNAVCLIEWANLINPDLLPSERIAINLDYGEEEDSRILTFETVKQ